MSSNYKSPPVFSDAKLNTRYVDELKAWTYVTYLELSLLENNFTHIRDKVFSELSIDELKNENRLQNMDIFMDKIFKKDELTQM